MRFSTTLVAVVLAGAASTAGAQVCLGTAAFSVGPIRADGSLVTGNNATSLGLGVSGGAERGAFGSVSLNRVEIDDADDSATGFGLRAGYELELSTTTSAKAAKWSFCPVAGFSYAKASSGAPGLDEELDVSMTDLSAGVALGTSIAASPSMTVMPFGTLSVLRERVKFEGFGLDDDVSETGGVLDLGVGFLLNRSFTVRPLVSIPLGFEGADPMIGVSVHFNFGK